MTKAEIVFQNINRYPVILDICIQRLYLSVDIYDPFEHFYYIFKGKKRKLLQNKKTIAKNTYRVELDLFCIDDEDNLGSTFLENGVYRFGFMDPDLSSRFKTKGVPIFDLAISESLARKIPSLCRVYKYGKNKYAYNLSFDISSTCDAVMHIKLSSFFVRIDKKWRKRNSIEVSERTGFRSRLNRISTLCKVKATVIAYKWFHMTQKQNSVVIMYKFTGTLAGNLAALHKRMLEREVDNDYRIVLQRSDGGGKKMTLRDYINTIKNLARAKFVFTDGPIPILKHLTLDNSTELIQLWHAGAGFKGAGFARFGVGASLFPNNSSHRQVDHALAPSKPLVKVFKEVFGIPEEKFFVANMPRLDNWLEKSNVLEKTNAFYNDYPQAKNKRIILFAPTYRGKVAKGYYPKHMMDYSRVYDFLGNDKLMIVKMHPNIKNPPELDDYQDRIIDLTNHTEINDILLVADILITDYSSTYYEFGLLKRPMVFYCFDKYIYENTRGVYQTVDDAAPGKVVETFEELLMALENEDYELEKTLKFHDDFFCDFDSQPNASDYVIDNFLLKDKS